MSSCAGGHGAVSWHGYRGPALPSDVLLSFVVFVLLSRVCLFFLKLRNPDAMCLATWHLAKHTIAITRY